MSNAPSPRSHSRRVRAWAAALVIGLVAAGAVVFHFVTSELDKRDAIEWSGLGSYVSRGDIRWITAAAERGGMTYRYFAIIPAEKMRPTSLGHPEGDENFVVRDQIRRSGSTDAIYRSISYVREAQGIEPRRVFLVVGASTSERASAG